MSLCLDKSKTPWKCCCGLCRPAHGVIAFGVLNLLIIALFLGLYWPVAIILILLNIPLLVLAIKKDSLPVRQLNFIWQCIMLVINSLGVLIVAILIVFID